MTPVHEAELGKIQHGTDLNRNPEEITRFHLRCSSISDDNTPNLSLRPIPNAKLHNFISSYPKCVRLVPDTPIKPATPKG